MRLAQAISSTSAALIISTSSGVRVSPTIASRSGIDDDGEAAVVRWMLAREIAADRRCELTLRGLVRDARLQAADRAEPLRGPRHHRLGGDRREIERAVEVDVADGPTKSRGSMPITGARHSIDAHVRPSTPGVAVEQSLPCGVRQEHAARRVGHEPGRR